MTDPAGVAGAAGFPHPLGTDAMPAGAVVKVVVVGAVVTGRLVVEGTVVGPVPSVVDGGWVPRVVVVERGSVLDGEDDLGRVTATVELVGRMTADGWLPAGSTKGGNRPKTSARITVADATLAVSVETIRRRRRRAARRYT